MQNNTVQPDIKNMTV